MNVKRIPLLVGVAILLAALSILVGVTDLNVTQGFVAAVGLVAIGAALNGFARRRRAVETAETTDPEHRTTVPVPGANFSETINQFRTDTYTFATGSRQVLEGLQGAAVAVLTRFEGLSEEAAKHQIETGEWTSDERVAAFLSPELEAPGRPIRSRLAAVLDRESSFRSDVRRTTAAIAAIGYTGLEAAAPESIPQSDAETLENVVPRTTAASTTGLHLTAVRDTGYWTGVGGLALLAVGLGAVAESPSVVLAGVVAAGYAGFAHIQSVPEPTLSLERTLSDEQPEPGEEVDVTVTITNDSGRLLADLRIIDGVPAGLAITDGSARIGTALRPEESVDLEYTVTARRGTHTFDPAVILTRDLSRASEKEYYLGVETTMTAEPTLKPLATQVPLQPAAAAFSGQLTTADAGEGMQFHSIREYQRNDPLNRIDWNRHARSGELATLQFHEERAARVVILIDARKSSYLAPEPDAPHAVDRSVEAAGRIAASLLDTGDTVGLAALGPVDRTGDRKLDLRNTCWLAPSSGQHHRGQLRSLLSSHPQFSTVPPNGRTQWHPQLRLIRQRLTSETQVVLFTPLCDDASVRIARRLGARGHAVTVISPDPTAERTTSQQLARVGRRIRRFDLQRAGIPVIDWTAEQSIDEAVARANSGDSR
ncbi:DUF58 domain-containing protein [Natrialbaceae archaeon A-CW2]|uniref:DUF58 domain-containing protein n=1 Tax=Natronosalvus amylolyticus TaxID=2961994 RepID=UPI0020C9EF2D|nr:DUF58 domain-containing protein [Natronosalvus amylolyticus]